MSGKRHQSIFSYNLTKPYPYTWLTWLVVIGGIAATALFSVVSIAANGFDTALITVSNPNETESPSTPLWFQKQPWSLANKISSKCQDQVFNIGANVYTSTLLRTYLLQYIYKTNDPTTRTRNSLAYHHSSFEHCAIAGAAIAAWPTGYNVSILSVCTVYDDHVPTSIELWNSYDNSGSNGIISDFGSAPSWAVWASALIVSQQLSIFQLMTQLSNGTTWMARADYFFPRASTAYLDQKVVSSASLTYGNTNISARIGETWQFDSDTRVWPASSLANKTNVTLSAWSAASGIKASSLFDTFAENGTSYSQPWNASSRAVALGMMADNIIRILYSSVLSDFGQTPSVNIFSTPLTLFDSVDAIDKMYKDIGTDTFMSQVATQLGPGSERFYPLFQFNETTRQNISTLFAWADTTASSLTPKPAFLNTLYLCQIPKMKSILSLIVSVIIADLVFLQALWTIFSFVIKCVLERQDDTANHCSGCMAALRSSDNANDDFVNGKTKSSTEKSRRSNSISRGSFHETPIGSSDELRNIVIEHGPLRLPNKSSDESTTFLLDTREVPPSP